MSIFATEPLRYSNVVKQELFPESAFCRATVVANEAAAKTYAVGTVLGKVTATVSRGGLVLDATYDNATKIATAIAALEVLGIKVIGTV